MAKAVTVVDQTLVFSDGNFVAYIRVYKVAISKKFVEGIKLRCVLVDQAKGVPVLLLDNHAPFGYHIHSRLPEDAKFRTPIAVDNYIDAIQVFLQSVERFIKDGHK